MTSSNALKNQFQKASLSPISHILRFLMDSTGIKEAELARKTSVPQTTLNRLLTNPNVDPRTNTLKPLADFFQISIDQLLGYAALSNEQPSFVETVSNKLPVLEMKMVLNWRTGTDFNSNAHKDWITTEKAVSNDAFAIRSEAYMEPRFRRNSLLIIEPEHDLTNDKYVLIESNNNIMLRQLLFDGQTKYLKHFDKTIPSAQYSHESHNYLGTVIEARLDQFD